MQPLLLHYCTICSRNTSVPFSASVFSQNQSCSHCGSISVGVNIQAKQQKEEKKMATMQQEELARLFSANMNLSHAPVQFVAPPQQLDQSTAQPITYISQHYTHTHHVVPVRHIPQNLEKTHIDAADLEGIFIRHSIDPSGLFPSQIDLFKNADDDQRLRLLELWRISPPQGRQGAPNGMDYNLSRQLYDWPPTSLAQEEAMAKLRYEKMMEERAQQEEIQRHQQQLEQSMTGPSSSPETGSAEPYVVSGYEMMARREYEESAKAANALRESTNYNQATDPVYNAQGNGLWDKNVGSLLDMENQYGAFAAAREYDAPHIYDDSEMVM
ncbi:hypothetical protein GQ43DRAFT_376957 [Delitschia confertaspora ATCC 74209]|uniref:Uncharacterized protein n=1 Tax=Delitschia confertaspora ATCC 74209 TaxID=1513339 RepID=A0A9P4MWN9_9PLEO|nr:hypothetical protein GQ43DRAFT_376957 [Delitschia confertaspora ATCC 74209]